VRLFLTFATMAVAVRHALRACTGEDGEQAAWLASLGGTKRRLMETHFYKAELQLHGPQGSKLARLG